MKRKPKQGVITRREGGRQHTLELPATVWDTSLCRENLTLWEIHTWSPQMNVAFQHPKSPIMLSFSLDRGVAVLRLKLEKVGRKGACWRGILSCQRAHVGCWCQETVLIFGQASLLGSQM